MRTLIVASALLFSAAAWAHGGHEEGAIVGGEMTGTDGIVYLDAGASMEWAGRKLLRKVTAADRIVYQHTSAQLREAELAGAEKPELAFKVPGGPKIKGFSFNHAGELPDPVVVIQPELGAPFGISRLRSFPVLWSAAHPASFVRIILEVLSESGELKGRLTLSTDDDGDFVIPQGLLAKLPAGRARMAIKRIRLGGFYPEKGKDTFLGVRTATSLVGSGVLVD